VKSFKLDAMTRGWFVGAFNPTAFSCDACEVGVKHYRANDKEALHNHLIATEITLVLYGHLRMVDSEWREGDIIVLSPGEATDFEALTDCATVVVKVPGALNDKNLL
jgi:predicted phosphodiesterase